VHVTVLNKAVVKQTFLNPAVNGTVVNRAAVKSTAVKSARSFSSHRWEPIVLNPAVNGTVVNRAAVNSTAVKRARSFFFTPVGAADGSREQSCEQGSREQGRCEQDSREQKAQGKRERLSFGDTPSVVAKIETVARSRP